MCVHSYPGSDRFLPKLAESFVICQLSFYVCWFVVAHSFWEAERISLDFDKHLLLANCAGERFGRDKCLYWGKNIYSLYFYVAYEQI